MPPCNACTSLLIENAFIIPSSASNSGSASSSSTSGRRKFQFVDIDGETIGGREAEPCLGSDGTLIVCRDFDVLGGHVEMLSVLGLVKYSQYYASQSIKKCGMRKRWLRGCFSGRLEIGEDQTTKSSGP
jgi:hypothetical protein